MPITFNQCRVDISRLTLLYNMYNTTTTCRHPACELLSYPQLLHAAYGAPSAFAAVPAGYAAARGLLEAALEGEGLGAEGRRPLGGGGGERGGVLNGVPG